MIPIPVLPAPVAPKTGPLPVTDDARLLAAAQKLEATFLSEMLKSAGFDSAGGGFAGSPGADSFMSFLRDAQALSMVGAGGIGLAESLFHAMKSRANA